jgi:hypothetical protein
MIRINVINISSEQQNSMQSSYEYSFSYIFSKFLSNRNITFL